MSLALIEMANKILGTAKGFSDYKMTAKDALRKCQGLDKVHCPTVELKVQESGDYNEIIGELFVNKNHIFHVLIIF